MSAVNLPLPSECPDCGFENLNIFGTRINGKVSVEIRCMKCGKPILMSTVKKVERAREEPSR